LLWYVCADIIAFVPFFLWVPLWVPVCAPNIACCVVPSPGAGYFSGHFLGREGVIGEGGRFVSEVEAHLNPK